MSEAGAVFPHPLDAPRRARADFVRARAERIRASTASDPLLWGIREAYVGERLAQFLVEEQLFHGLRARGRA